MTRIAEAPFDSGRKMMSTVHKTDNGFIQFTKGAPDVIIRQCDFYLEDGKMVPMTKEYEEKILAANKEMADKALRVLACAQSLWDKQPTDFEPEDLEQKLCFTGLCGMIDPVRPEVKDAIVECNGAGIRAIMITGDHVDTACAIAKELGILKDGTYALTGAKLNEMSDEEFAKEDAEYFAQLQRRRTVLLILIAVAVVLIGFILFRIISRELERRRRLREEELLRKQQAAREAALWEAKDDGMEVTMSVEETRRMELQENAIAMAKEHPEDVAMLIRTWLMEE